MLNQGLQLLNIRQWLDEDLQPAATGDAEVLCFISADAVFQHGDGCRQLALSGLVSQVVFDTATGNRAAELTIFPDGEDGAGQTGCRAPGLHYGKKMYTVAVL